MENITIVARPTGWNPAAYAQASGERETKRARVTSAFQSGPNSAFQSTKFKTAAAVLQEEKAQPPKFADVTVQCKLCGNAAVTRISRSEKNPGKKYWACPNNYCTNKFIE